MLVVPTSRIILLKNPIEIDYMNELTFSSKTAQYNYFYNLPKLECDNATYQRKDEVVRFPTDPNMDGITYDDLIKYNYCMYQNDKWSDKWFYAFIKDITFDNTGMSYIELETDVWQSWMFDITFKPSFIEREHVNDDTIGKHTIPEELEMGDVVVANKVEHLNDSSNFKICVCLTEINPNITIPSAGQNINKVYSGIYSGVYYIACDSPADATNLIKIYDKLSKADAIYCMFMIPTSLCEFETYSWSYDGISATVSYIAYDTESFWMGGPTIDIPTSIDTYTPANNKLFTYPYCYCNVTNNSGITVPFRYEDSTEIDSETNRKCLTFSLEASITPGLSIKAIPKNYKGLTENYNYGITLGKFPICSWTSDVYVNWLTQNGTNATLNVLTSAVGGIGSAIAGSPIGAFSGAVGVFHSMHQFTVAKLTPDQARGNVNSGDINFSYTNSGGLSLYNMTIKKEYCQIIDKYFSAYGYKVNTFKTPNIYGRTNWNYVKTIGCNIIGDIPQNDLQKIKDIFNNGVTFWHNPSTFLDYSQNNTIV